MRLIVRIRTDPTPQNLPLAVIPLVAWDQRRFGPDFELYVGLTDIGGGVPFGDGQWGLGRADNSVAWSD